MKKSLIALAALAAVSAASAQSTVTISGAFSVGMSSEMKKNTIAGIDATNSNLIGFTVVEDLGQGLKATGHMGMRFDMNRATNKSATSTSGTASTTVYDSASGIKNSGDVYVDLAGAFGAVRAGTFTFHSNGGLNAFNTWGLSRLDGGTTLASSNQIRYTTPKVAGFSAALSTFEWASTTDGTGVVGSKNGTGVKLSYANGPLSADYVRHTFGSATATAGAENTTLGGSYDFGMVKVFAMTYVEKAAVTGAKTEDGNSISANIPFGAATFKIGRVEKGIKTSVYDRVSYGVDYALSKRSTINANVSTNKAATTGVKADGNYFVGIAHTF